jgi:predicted DNA-binding transcriptional regulator AlpA
MLSEKQRPGGSQGIADGHGNSNPTIRFMPRAVQWVEPIAYGWPQVILATSHSRRVLEGKIASGEFPQPHFRSGRRPYWLKSQLVEWAQKAGER